MSKKTAVLDLSGCKYLGELHQRIKKALGFPDYYGENWDAFWDCINRDCDVERLTIIGASDIAKELIPSVKIMEEILEENKQYWADSDCPFDYEIID